MTNIQYSLFAYKKLDDHINNLDEEKKDKYFKIYEKEKKDKLYVYSWFVFLSIWGLFLFNKDIKYSMRFLIVQIITFIVDVIFLILSIITTLGVTNPFIFGLEGIIFLIFMIVFFINIVFTFLEIEKSYLLTDFTIKNKILKFLESEE